LGVLSRCAQPLRAFASSRESIIRITRKAAREKKNLFARRRGGAEMMRIGPALRDIINRVQRVTGLIG
jgi:hypothetical protein